MRCTLTAAIGLLAGLCGPAFAGPEGTWWEGGLTTYKATPECNESIGYSFKSTLRPAGFENNSPSATFVSLVFGRGAATIELPKAGKSGRYSLAGVSSRGHYWTYSDASLTFSQRTTTPGKLAKKTQTVGLSITLQNFWGTPGCAITFKGSYTAHPAN